MLKLDLPTYTCAQALERCCEGITGNPGLLKKVTDNKQLIEQLAQNYQVLASTEDLYALDPINLEVEDPVAVGLLKKTELIKLYGTYFVNDKKPGRLIYNAIMASANEQCPFCGGIGRPRNLDHYLPKAYYPQFSVLPINLIPSCRDCNMDGKGENFARRKGDQVLHPYLDDSRYFNEQWLFARFDAGVDNEPGVIEYFVQPPDSWDEEQKKRVTKHFNDFNLALRFSKEAGSRLVTYLAQINALLQIPLELDVVKNTILRPVINSAPFINHWERVMCLALFEQLSQENIT